MSPKPIAPTSTPPITLLKADSLNALKQLQMRRNWSEAPPWLQLVWDIAREAPSANWSPSNHLGVHLVQAMDRVGKHYLSQTDPTHSSPEPVHWHWYCQRPDQHLMRVAFNALGALGITLPAHVVYPALPDTDQPEEHLGYVRATTLALKWLQSAANAPLASTASATAWDLPASTGPLAQLPEAAVRVLLQAGEGGAIALLRLRAMYEPGANLLLAPMPASLCLLLDADFGAMLNTVPLFLRRTLESPNRPDLPHLTDIALAWDLAPPDGEDTPFDAVYGDSAGAAFACAALLALVPYAPKALQETLRAARDSMGEAFMTAAIAADGALLWVGGLPGKTSALEPLAQALSGWQGRQARQCLDSYPLYLASKQALPPLPPIFQPTPLAHVTDILRHIAQRAEPASPVHDEALALVLQHRTHLAAGAAVFAQPQHQGLAQRLLDEPVHRWRHLAVRGLARWEHQGGPLQTQFVPLCISERSGGAWGKTLFANLDQLLAEKRLNPTAFALEGPPGAGKTTLLRHHMQTLAHVALSAADAPPTGRQSAAVRVLPMYLSLASWDDTAIPAGKARTTAARDAWMRSFVRAQVGRQLREEGWSEALARSLYETPAHGHGHWCWRWLIDGLNEAPHPANETRQTRVEGIVRALKAEYGMRLPMLMSVREDHINVSDWVWVKVEAWDESAIALYLRQRFAALAQVQPAQPDQASGDGGEAASRLLELIRALPEGSRALYTRPMPLAMLCDLHLERPDLALPRHPAALHTANLWFNLRRQMGLTRHLRQNNPLLRDTKLLSIEDQNWLEQAHQWPESPDELPQGGLLLRGLLNQAETQYWSDKDQGKKQDQRCTVAVPLATVQLRGAGGKPVDLATRRRWLQAAEALGLADPQAMRKGEFRFAHQSWGEFLASVRLLRGSPDALHSANAAGHPAEQKRWAQVFVQTRAPEAGRADAQGQVAVLGAQAELQALESAVQHAWGAVPPAVWQRLLAQGLTAPLEAVLRGLSKSGDGLWSEADFWHASARAQPFVLVKNPEQHDPQTDVLWRTALGEVQLHTARWAKWAGTGITSGTADWSDHPIGWLTWYQSLWAPFQIAFEAWLRAQPEFAAEGAQQRVKDLLASQGRLGLPPPADTREVLTLALTGLPPARAADWLAALIAQGDWRAAVPAALLLRPQLEAPMADVPVDDGHWFDAPHHRHPVLQHLRRLLLLRAVDAGAAVRQRLRHGGVLAALGQPVKGLSPALQAHWQSTWHQAFAPGQGVDLRERLQAGLWLGALGDNLRYLRWCVASTASDGVAGRVGICLHPRHWRGPGRPGQKLAFRIGAEDPLAEQEQGMLGNAQPAWTAHLPAARFAVYPVTVMEWAALRGQAAPAELQRATSGWTDSDRNNPLMPITGISWYEAMALTDWYRPIYHDLLQQQGPKRWVAVGLRLGLPTEVQREAGARGPITKETKEQRQARYTHTPSPDDPPLPLVFNHHATRWHRPHPVGVFSRGLNPWGLDDLAGNVWTWCANAYTPDYRGPHSARANQALDAHEVEVNAMDASLPALRGGSFYNSAFRALAAYRGYYRPYISDPGFGLRWLASPHL